jgi:hypothetical protein
VRWSHAERLPEHRFKSIKRASEIKSLRRVKPRRRRLNSEQFRSASMTYLPRCGRLSVQQTDRRAPVAGGHSFLGERRPYGYEATRVDLERGNGFALIDPDHGWASSPSNSSSSSAEFVRLEELAMKLRVVVLILSVMPIVYPSAGYSQQQAVSPAGSAATSSSNQQPGPFLSQGSTARIRVIGTPVLQPSPGLGIECTPVEQEIVGVMIGPTNLCDR